jgi:hypothetical protein
VPGEFKTEGAVLLVYAFFQIRRRARVRAMGGAHLPKYGQMRSKRAGKQSFRDVFPPLCPSPDSGSGGC